MRSEGQCALHPALDGQDCPCCGELRAESDAVKDLRDPIALGEKLLRRRLNAMAPTKPLSYIADFSPLRVPDYVSPNHPHDHYGDPRCIKSTLPN